MKNDREEKKSYQKPTLTRYPLKPEEAVLGFCKTASSNGSSQPNSCTSPTACTFPGS
jgi:hypothetical protein